MSQPLCVACDRPAELRTSRQGTTWCCAHIDCPLWEFTDSWHTLAAEAARPTAKRSAAAARPNPLLPFSDAS